MRYAVVTETWPPEINGVALTVQALAHGLPVLVQPRVPVALLVVEPCHAFGGLGAVQGAALRQARGVVGALRVEGGGLPRRASGSSEIGTAPARGRG